MSARAAFVASAVALFVASCGDVRSELITREPASATCTETGCSPDSPVCDPRTELCRGCVVDEECGQAAPRCDGTSGRCIECRVNTDCGDFERPFCDDTRRCVECVSDGHCEDPSETCSALLGACAQPCSGDDDCPADDRICDLASGAGAGMGYCVECLDDDDCAAELICRRLECESGE